MKNKKSVYLLSLSGQGDTFLVVVDKEIFDWVVSDDPGKPPGAEDESSWEDQLVPQRLADKLKEGSNWPLHITRGSWENDRAIAAMALPAEGYDDAYDSIRELNRALKETGAEIAEEYQGYIY